MAGTKKRQPYKRYVLLVAVVLLVVLGIRPGDRSLYAPPIKDGVTIYLINNAYHSDITVPTAELAKLGGSTDAAVRQLDPAPWVAIGWGDASFYSNSGFNFARAMDRAEGAVHAGQSIGGPSLRYQPPSRSGLRRPRRDPHHPLAEGL